ncbi:MAG TPA: SPFH domain-containing protein [Gemmataceae bacterium]|nr:SPFH domain-containing protein [Gemmataceae bacterium]
MTRAHEPPDRNDVMDVVAALAPGGKWKRIAIVAGVLFFVTTVGFILVWTSFYKYVPPGKHLVVIAKNGDPLDPGEVLAKEGQKGIRRDVLGEGWHLVMPIVYTTELEPNTIIPPGKVGIVTALGGTAPTGGRVLAEKGEQGIQRQVLPPGAYRINMHGYQIEEVPAVEIKPGFVGVVRRLLGSEGKGLFAAEGSDEKGFLPRVLQPGFYYINTKEYDVITTEVGIIQTAFHAPEKSRDTDTSITFTSKGGFPISIDCTVEWEVLPEHMPALVAEYGTWKEIEKKVIDVQAHAICRDKGIDYGVQEFLEGTSREKFQEDFTQELTKVCKDKNVTVRSAFIRRILIPEEYLKPIREKQIAAETEMTTKAKELTAETENDVEREQRMIEQEIAKVGAETKLLVANIDQEVKNINVRNEAEIEKMKEEYGAKIAALEAERKQVLGQAEAEVTKLTETAKSSLYQMKMEVFQNDGNAFLRYTMAQKLNDNLILRLFHSGNGTFWTNMGDKNMNLLLPAPVGQDSPKKENGKETNGDSKK